jgi:hypothetical protein
MTETLLGDNVNDAPGNTRRQLLDARLAEALVPVDVCKIEVMA